MVTLRVLIVSAPSGESEGDSRVEGAAWREQCGRKAGTGQRLILGSGMGVSVGEVFWRKTLE